MESVVRAIVADAFSDADPTAFTETRTGNNKHTVVVTLANDRQVVVQYRDIKHGSLAPDARVTAYLDDRTGVPVPEVLASGRVDRHSYLVTRLVEGTNLHDQFESFSREEQLAIVETLGAHLGRLHERFQFDGYGSIAAANEHLTVPEPASSWREWIESYLEAGLEAFTAPVEDLVTPIRTTVSNHLLDLPDEPPAQFYPWDFRPGNVLVSGPTDPSIVAVLDWGDPLAADPGLSLAKSEYLIADWYADPELATDLRTAYYEGYRTTSSIPTNYFEQHRPIYRLVGITRSMYDSDGDITRPRYPMTDEATAAAFHRRHIEPLLAADAGSTTTR